MSDEMRAIAEAARRATPIDRAIAVLALAASADPRAFTRADRRPRDGRRRASCGSWSRPCSTRRRRRNRCICRSRKAWAPDNKHAADLIRRALVLLADHELNASTFTVRCAASTGLNLYDAIIAGLAALKGPKHGGAGVLAAQLVKTLVDQRRRARHPRARRARRTFCRASATASTSAAIRARSRCWKRWRVPARARKFTHEVPERIAEATGEFVNIDYALAVLVHTLRLAAGQRTGAVCHGAQRRLDRACQRTIAARPADPPPRALCRPGAGPRRGC